MIILPAIDLHHGCAVRLFKGDYAQMTEYSNAPEKVAKYFEECGASDIHLVDLEGAKTGETVNIASVEKIVKSTNLTAELGGGIRSMEVVDKYLDIGVKRVILGTAALKDPVFLEKAVSKYGKKIAVGIDVNNGKVAVSGWTEISDVDFRDFCKKMENLGVQTVICTDISRDGAMQGTNRALYAELQSEFNMNIIASGGVSSLEDVDALAKLGVYGAILGKAIYTGAIDLKEALKVAKMENSVKGGNS